MKLANILNKSIKVAINDSEVNERLEYLEKARETKKLEEVKSGIANRKISDETIDLIIRIGFDFRLKDGFSNRKEDIVVTIAYRYNRNTKQEAFKITDRKMVTEI